MLIRQSKFSLNAIGPKNNFIRTVTSAVLGTDDNAAAKLKPWSEIPGPPSLPVIGQILSFLPGGKIANLKGYDLMDYMYKTYGPIIKLDALLGRNAMVMVLDPEAIATVLRSENWLPVRPGFESLEYYKKKHEKATTPERTGLLTDHGDNWKKIRSAVNPVLLQPKTIKLYETALSKVADDMIDRLRFLRDGDINSQFDREMNLWALESIGVVALGCRLNCFDPNLPKDSPAHQLIKAVHDFFQTTEKLDFQPSTWRFFKTKSFYDAMKSYENQEKLCGYFVKKSTEELKKRTHSIPDDEKGVLEKLLEIDEEIAYIMACDMLFAGVDTAANTIIATMYLLAKNPEKQNTLREGLKNNPGDKKYLKACLKEGMRLMPVTGGNIRLTTKEYNILGYHIPKDIYFVAANEYLAKMESQYPQPKEYIPERWISPKTDPLYHGNAHPYAMGPFGFGARSCVGRRIAELETETFLAKMIQTFQIEWDGGPPNIRTTSLNYISGPFHFKLKDL